MHSLAITAPLVKGSEPDSVSIVYVINNSWPSKIIMCYKSEAVISYCKVAIVIQYRMFA